MKSPFWKLNHSNKDNITETFYTLSEDNRNNFKVISLYLKKLFQHELYEKILPEITLMGLNENSIDDLPLSIVMIECYLYYDMIETAMKLFQRQTRVRKRHINLIIDYLISKKMYTRALQLINRYHEWGWSLDGEDLNRILNTPIQFHILPLFQSSTIATTRYDLAVPATGVEHKLRKIPFTDEECKQIIQNLPLSRRDTHTHTHTRDIKYVIDGANVLYYRYREITPLQLQQITQLLDGDYIIILHERHRHRKITSLIDLSKVVWTPYRENDDYYSLYYSLLYRAYIITNDKFRDHIQKIPLLKTWCAEYCVGYSYIDNQLQLKKPLSYSCRHQSDRDNYYIPTDNNLWVVINKKSYYK